MKTVHLEEEMAMGATIIWVLFGGVALASTPDPVEPPDGLRTWTLVGQSHREATPVLRRIAARLQALPEDERADARAAAVYIGRTCPYNGAVQQAFAALAAGIGPQGLSASIPAPSGRDLTAAEVEIVGTRLGRIEARLEAAAGMMAAHGQIRGILGVAASPGVGAQLDDARAATARLGEVLPAVARLDAETRAGLDAAHAVLAPSVDGAWPLKPVYFIYQDLLTAVAEDAEAVAVVADGRAPQTHRRALAVAAQARALAAACSELTRLYC